MQALRQSRRLGSIFVLAFAAGLPLVLVMSTLQAWLTQTGAALTVIGMFGMVQQPYVYKVLWAPLIDRFPVPLLGRRRGWMLCMQLCIIAGLLGMAMIDPRRHLWPMWWAAFAVALFSATQDIAYDAYRTDLLTEEERGIASAFYVTGYRIAILVAGAFGLVFADRHGFRATYILMAMLMLLGVAAVLAAPKLRRVPSPPTVAAAFVDPVREFIARPRWALILAAVILYKFGDAFNVSLTTAFLLRGLHFSLSEVGVANKTGAMIAALAGGFVGGAVMVRVRLFTALFCFGVLQMLSNFAYMILALVGKNFLVMVAAIMTENFFSGMGTIAFLAFLMALCDKRYSAAQFALFATLDSIGRVFIGPLAGYLATHLGWPRFYFITVLSGLPVLAVLWFLKTYIDGLKSVNYS